jgi:anti-sigma regulatory factor (Ser/Thr protein kinase)
MQLRFEVVEKSQVLEVRRRAAELAEQLGFGELHAGRAALAVTEAGTNLVKHAEHGEIFVRPLAKDGFAGVELLVVDKGPGIASISQSLVDGFSTTGSAGTGLGALSRIADEFDIYSLTGKGTAIRIALWNGASRSAVSAPMELGVVCRALPGEDVCGDDWDFAGEGHKSAFALADGLGHGPDAHKAARAAIDCLHRGAAARGPAACLQDMHEASRATRGSAAAVCEVDAARGLCRFAGVGNIACTILSNGMARRMVSHSGIVGHSVRKIQEFSAPWAAGELLVMHSDGLSTHWNVSQYPGLASKHPGLIAAVLYRDFNRDRDDATVLVARHHGALR